MNKSKKRYQPPVQTAAVLQPSAAWGGYEGSLTSPERGWIYIPRVESSAEVDHLSRSVLLDRIGHLYRNGGKPRRIINCITRMVTGTGLTPEPMTRDAAYNDRVKALWARDAESPKSFSLSGKFGSDVPCRCTKCGIVERQKRQRVRDPSKFA